MMAESSRSAPLRSGEAEVARFPVAWLPYGLVALAACGTALGIAFGVVEGGQWRTLFVFFAIILSLVVLGGATGRSVRLTTLAIESESRFRRMRVELSQIRAVSPARGVGSGALAIVTQSPDGTRLVRIRGLKDARSAAAAVEAQIRSMRT